MVAEQLPRKADAGETQAPRPNSKGWVSQTRPAVQPGSNPVTCLRHGSSDPRIARLVRPQQTHSAQTRKETNEYNAGCDDGCPNIVATFF